MEPGIQASSSHLYGDHDATTILMFFQIRVGNVRVRVRAPAHFLVAGLNAYLLMGEWKNDVYIIQDATTKN